MNSCLTEFSEELYKKGVFEEGRVEASIENARNLFLNGAPYELVRKSIEPFQMNSFTKSTTKFWLVKMNK